MFTMVTDNARRVFSAVAAVAVVAFGALAMDQGHLGAAPRGVVEVGDFTILNPERLVHVTLPEVVVTAARIGTGPAQAAAALPMLPEVVVTASRTLQVAHEQAPVPADTQG